MSDTYGQSLIGLLPNVAPELSSESKLPAEADDRKMCAGCGTVKLLSDFYKNQPSIGGGYRTKCKECYKARSSAWREKPGSKTKTSATFVAYRRSHRAKILLTLAKHRASLKGLEYSLDQYEEEIQSVIDAGVCQVTGLPLNLDGGKTWDSPSLDRIDSTKGYARENVRIVLYCVNVMANLWGPNKIIKIAAAIQVTRRKQSENFSTRIAEKIRSQTDSLGSTLFRLTWKDRVTPSGRLIPQLAASALPTGGKGCIGWPSPKAGHDGSTVEQYEARRLRGYENRKGKTNGGPSGKQGDLAIASQLASWTTPQAHDVTARGKGQKAKHGTKHGCADLNQDASLASWPTPMAGSPATEEYNEAGNTDYSRKVVELSAWPTPNAMEGGQTSRGGKRKEEKLMGGIVKLASWPTPMDDNANNATRASGVFNSLTRTATWATPASRDFRSNDASEDYHEKHREQTRGKPLNEEVHQLLTASGPAPNGSTAATKSTGQLGQLNPGHSRWLMGLPLIWDLCGMAIQRSSRRSSKKEKTESDDSGDTGTP